MAKIGSPIGPGVTRLPGESKVGRLPTTETPKQQPQGRAEGGPRTTEVKVPIPQQPPAPPPGSALAQAGRLAGQFLKGLVNPAPQQRAEKPSTERKGEREGTHSAEGEGEHAGNTELAGQEGALGAAFQALRRSRLFNLRRKRKKKVARGEVERAVLDNNDDYAEDEGFNQHTRAWLGVNEEETPQDQARRGAMMLQVLERQGEPPSRVMSQLNSHLVPTRGAEYKRLLSDEVRPQMEALAQRTSQIPAEERRKLAVLVTRAAHQSGPKNAAAFAGLLASAGEAEAAELAASFEGVVTRAMQLTEALRRAASPAYRAALIQAGRGNVENLTSEAVKLSPEEQPLAWGALLRAAELLEPDSILMMAEAVVDGLLGSGNPAAATALGAELSRVPGGGCLVAQVVVVLMTRGEEEVAGNLAAVLHGTIREAREEWIPIFKGLRALHMGETEGVDEQQLLFALNATFSSLSALFPACAWVFELSDAMPPGTSELFEESILALSTLDIMGATVCGQKMLRQALLAQEQGGQTFLKSLPQVASTLAQPSLIPIFPEIGLDPRSYVNEGEVFMQHMAAYIARVISGPVLARSQKGDAAGARSLLRSAVRNNADLFGLSFKGARLAVEALEELRDKPSPQLLQTTVHLLEEIFLQHPSEQRAGTADCLRELASALAERDRRTPMQLMGEQVVRKVAEFSLREVLAEQHAVAKRQGLTSGETESQPQSLQRARRGGK